MPASPTVVPIADLSPAHLAESHLGRILGVSSVILALAATFVALRLYVRIKFIRSIGRDDWAMAACLLCSVGGWIIFVIQGQYGLGHHNDTLTLNDKIMFAKVGFWQSIISAAAAMGLLKVSIALNLLRLSPNRWFSWPLWASIAITVAFVSIYTFLAWLTFFLHCKPMAKAWDVTITEGSCYPIGLFVQFALINTGFNIFTDIFFATMPIPIIWQLQMKRKVRLYLIGVLSLGYVAVIMGILKAVAQINFSKDNDKTYNQWVQFWGFLQLNTGIIAACCPSIKPLVSKVLKLSEYGSSSYGTRSRTTGALRTIGGGGGQSNMHSRSRDMYELRDLADSGELAENDGKFKTHAPQNGTVADARFYKEGDRSGSEELILGAPPQHGQFKGIMMTREVIVK